MSTSVPSPTVLPDLSGLEFWRQPLPVREAAFARLRDSALSWHREPEGALIPAMGGTGGYWAAVRYDDVRQVSRDTEHFVSGRGVMLEDMPAELLEFQSFLPMDGNQHRRLRGLVSSGFTPRQVKRLEDGARADVLRILDGLEDHPDGDFVELVARPLPLMTITRMLGVAEEDQVSVAQSAEAIVSWNDPDFQPDGMDPLTAMIMAVGTLYDTCQRYCDERRRAPGNDLLSALVQAEIDGERLTDAQIATFFVLLSVAGNDTTRHTTSHAMLALTANPDQRRFLLEDLDGRIDRAVEEFVRWASPIIDFRRTVAKPTELRGQPLEVGQKVVMFYNSANRDERAFEQPDRFDIARDPNPHFGFGGGGPHFCLGAALARVQLKLLFSELLRRYPQIEVENPKYLIGNFVNGVTRLPMHCGERVA